MVIEGCLVLVDLIKPDPVVVVGVLYCVEPQATGLVFVGSLGVDHQGF